MSEVFKINLFGVMTIPLVAALCYAALPAEVLTTETKTTTILPSPSGEDPDPRPPASTSRRELGRWLFRRNCSACHGPEGIGGIRNENYIKDTYPRLNTLAQKMMFADEEDAAAVVGALESGEELRADILDIAKPGVVLAQYEAIRNVIRNGSRPGKKDSAGPEPTAMPVWGDRLDDRDIDAILAYLITLQEWEAEE